MDDFQAFQDWSDEFPGTSDLVTAAVWPDQLKCGSHSTICPRDWRPLKRHFLGEREESPFANNRILWVGFHDESWPHKNELFGWLPTQSFLLEFSHRTLGNMNTMLTVAYLSMGWFNHQLANVCQKKGRADVFLFPRRLGSMKKLDWLWRKCNMDHGAVCKSICFFGESPNLLASP